MWCEVPRDIKYLWTLDGVSMVRGWSVTCYSDADRDSLRSGHSADSAGSLSMSIPWLVIYTDRKVFIFKKNRILKTRSISVLTVLILSL